MIIAGIDPGLDGGVAVLSDYGTLDTALLPTVEICIGRVIDSAALARWLHERDVEEIVIERVWASRVDDRPQGGSSMFTFGRAFGQIVAVCQLGGWPVQYITALEWKKRYDLLNNKKRNHVVPKDASRLRAIEMWPELADQFSRKKDGHRAEAALLANYALQGG